MGDFVISLEGTDAGRQVALFLALMAAFLHALFGALQKGRHDPWLSRAAIDLSYGVMAAPFALFVVPWPEPHMWPIFAVVFVIHVAYKLCQAYTYALGSYTVVYPIVRGSGPLFVVIAASVVFSEYFTLMQWIGVFILVGGIFLLSFYNLRYWHAGREQLKPALVMALITGLTVAAYTTYDAYGIRATADPFTFLAWFFFIDGFFMPILALYRVKKNALSVEVLPLMRRGILGGLIAYFSFGSIMLATRLDRVGEAAVLRETSTVFAALIGWLVLGEKVGMRRVMMMGLIAAGAVLVEFGG